MAKTTRAPYVPLHAAPAPFTTVDQLLDAIKARYGVPSERKLAQLMEWSESQLRHYRKGRSSPNDAVAQEIARKLDLGEGMVVAICHAEREQDAQVRAMWQHMARQLSRLTATALAVGFVAAPAPPAHASTSELRAGSVYSVKRRRRQIAVAIDRRWRPDRRRTSRPAAALA